MDLHFSIDQPFGFKLYPYFQTVYQIIVGRPTETFVFVPGATPLSTDKEGKTRAQVPKLTFLIADPYQQSFQHVSHILSSSSALAILCNT